MTRASVILNRYAKGDIEPCEARRLIDEWAAELTRLEADLQTLTCSLRPEEPLVHPAQTHSTLN
ncbi:MAG: hypothetical protein UY95_C0005G0006 [Parcubacteria group bacterium GW2011_GWA2_56_7]|nr:MAG: hypothetical protein UY95_C0005G0006 [Parcubacteria group bacterium GW2011_GWA2_56_7]